jgi:hypothetical protein
LLRRFAESESIPHAPPVRATLQQLIDEVLNPLLEKDASSIELVDVDDDEVIVRVTGRAAFGVGAEYVRKGIIEPALRKVVGEDFGIQIEKAVPTPKRRQ